MTSKELYLFTKEIDFPDQACVFLSDAYQKLLDDPSCRKILESCLSGYRNETGISFMQDAERLAAESRRLDIHPYTSDMLFYLHLAPALKEKYREKKLSDLLFYGAMKDLRCKLSECYTVCHIWGSFVAIWFSRFYNFSLYTLGRLEFCLIPCPFDYQKDGKQIRKGQPVIDVHIPSSGKLTREALDDSYRQAAAFFAPLLQGPAAFHCESWLLFEFHWEMLPAGCGILLFSEDYDLIRNAPEEGDMWRIFGDGDIDHPETLPEKTSLQRAYKKRLMAGLPVYGGEGIFFHKETKS